LNEELLIDLIKDCYEFNKTISLSVHEKAMNLYRVYLISGGMPESVKNMMKNKKDYIKYNRSILTDIINAYFKDMNKYVTNENEALKINRIYDSLPSQLSNLSKKFQYSKIDKNARKREYETALDWLLASNIVLRSKMIKIPGIPLEGFIDNSTFKIYLNDVGILNNLLNISILDILSYNISLYKGIIAENYVATELISNYHNLYYWQKNESEVDFLLYTKDGIIPVEFKANDNTKSKSLNSYINNFKPKYSIRISTKILDIIKKIK